MVDVDAVAALESLAAWLRNESLAVLRVATIQNYKQGHERGEALAELSIMARACAASMGRPERAMLPLMDEVVLADEEGTFITSESLALPHVYELARQLREGQWNDLRQHSGIEVLADWLLAQVASMVAIECRASGGDWPSIGAAAKSLGVGQGRAHGLLAIAVLRGELERYHGERNAIGHRALPSRPIS